jgi:hypothetical protein
MKERKSRAKAKKKSSNLRDAFWFGFVDCRRTGDGLL